MNNRDLHTASPNRGSAQGVRQIEKEAVGHWTVKCGDVVQVVLDGMACVMSYDDVQHGNDWGDLVGTTDDPGVEIPVGAEGQVIEVNGETPDDDGDVVIALYWNKNGRPVSGVGTFANDSGFEVLADSTEPVAHEFA